MTQYSNSINPTEYTLGLNKHLWIPQIDTKTLQSITYKTKELLLTGVEQVKIYDLGCGPGRLTNKLARILHSEKVHIVGIDEDQKFIGDAIKHSSGLENISYQHAQLPQGEMKGDIFLLYGVRHHLDNIGERKKWKNMLIENLSEQGSVFLGDEFIPEYEHEEERLLNATKLYMNVIGDAFQIAGEVDELVRIEIMNWVEDLYGGGFGRGVIKEEDMSSIAMKCLAFKNKIEEQGYNQSHHDIFTLQEFIKNKTEDAFQSGISTESRGDYKISIEKQVEELSPLLLKNQFFSGNRKLYGGMGLLEFTK